MQNKFNYEKIVKGIKSSKNQIYVDPDLDDESKAWAISALITIKHLFDPQKDPQAYYNRECEKLPKNIQYFIERHSHPASTETPERYQRIVEYVWTDIMGRSLEDLHYVLKSIASMWSTPPVVH